MKFVDEAIILVVAGKGGDGCISFQKKKNIFYRKSDGGDGGDGGNVWILADENLNTLVDFRFKKKFCAIHGKNGNRKNKKGKNGEDLFVRVPLGTRIFNDTKNERIVDITYHGQKIMVAKGGKHGLGNVHFNYFKRNDFQGKIKGEKGEAIHLRLELMLLADVGTLGLPNAGKSTFVRSISKAKPKVANYPFTTLVPTLGVVRVGDNKNFVIADVPGIISGASVGYGLGLRFLKHLERCKILLHFVDLSSQNDNELINNVISVILEIKKYGKKIINKTRWLVFNKSDLLCKSEVKRKVFLILKKINWHGKYYIISSVRRDGLKKICEDIVNYL